MPDSDAAPTIQQLQQKMDESLERFLALIDTYSEDKMLEPTDAAGWNIRDHVMHLVAWADGIAALLRREDRWGAMGLSPETAATHNYDAMNAEIVVQHRHISPSAARTQLIDAHNAIIAAMSALTDEDIVRPYEYYIAPFTGNEGHPIYGYILGNTAHHYDEHTPWIKAIAEQY